MNPLLRPLDELADSFTQIVKELREAQQISGAVGPIEKRVKEAFNWIADRIERLLETTPIIHGQAELAAHDQKVREQVLEEVEHSLIKLDDDEWMQTELVIAAIHALASRADKKETK